MWTWVGLFFAWPSGGVWSNIVASFIWSALVWFPTILHLHRKVDRQHAELTEQAQELHNEAAQQRATHHAELRKHLGIQS